MILSLSLPISHPRGYSVDELEDHISQLHEYNDIKDAAQMLLGRLGERRWSGKASQETDPCPWEERQVFEEAGGMASPNGKGRGFPGGPAVRTSPSHAGCAGSIPG